MRQKQNIGNLQRFLGHLDPWTVDTGRRTPVWCWRVVDRLTREALCGNTHAHLCLSGIRSSFIQRRHWPPSMPACGHIPRTDELSYFWGISALSEDFWLNPDTVCLIPQPIVVCLKPSKVWGQMILVLPIAWENPPGIWQRSLKLSRLGLKKAHVFTRIKQTTTTKPGRPKILFSGRAGSVVWDCGFNPHHHRKKRKC